MEDSTLSISKIVEVINLLDEQKKESERSTLSALIEFFEALNQKKMVKALLHFGMPKEIFLGDEFYDKYHKFFNNIAPTRKVSHLKNDHIYFSWYDPVQLTISSNEHNCELSPVMNMIPS